MKAEIERFEIEKYFLEAFPDHLTSDECLSLYCLLAEERPGSLIMGVSEDTETILKQFAEKFGLELRVMGERNNLLNPGVFLTRREERFSILEKSRGKFYSCSDRDVGLFLGYPESAVKFYEKSSENQKSPAKIYLKQLEKLYRDEVIDEDDLKHLELVDYVPRPAEKNIMKAVERGKERKKNIEAFDKEEGINVGEIYVQEIFHQFELEDVLPSL